MDWTSWVHLSARSNQHQQVLWVCQMHTATTRKTLPPILPLHQHGKLTFPLCATCLEEKMRETMLDCSNICHDTNQEYQVLHMQNVWHIPETSEGLFQDYVNVWFKKSIKKEVSSWPAHKLVMMKWNINNISTIMKPERGFAWTLLRSRRTLVSMPWPR